MYEISEALRADLRHPDKNVRNEAVRTLSRIDHPEKLPILIAMLQNEMDLFVRETITFALVQMGHQAVSPLAHLLQAPNAEVRRTAAHVLSKLRLPEAIPALEDALNDKDADTLAKVIFALGQIGSLQSVPALLRQLGHESTEVRTTLSDVLARFGAVSQPLLIAALDSNDWWVREHAADSLGLIGGSDSVLPLTQKLNDTSVEVRIALLTALAQIGTRTAIEAIHSAVLDTEPRVSALARRLAEQMEAAVTPEPDAAYYHLQFASLDDSSAFIAALSRVFNAPRTDRKHDAHKVSEVWGRREADTRQVHLYLNQPALDCTLTAFGQPTVLGTCSGHAIPGRCALLIGRVPSKAMGMEDARRMIGKAFAQRTWPSRE